MFLMLGLSATPTGLIADAPAAVASALVLMFVARPIAVEVCLIPFRFPWREQLFIAWVGLRGAVPIIFALFPLLAGSAQAELILRSGLFRRAHLAHRAGLDVRLKVPAKPGPDERLELTPRPADGHAIPGYHLGTSTRARTSGERSALSRRCLSRGGAARRPYAHAGGRGSPGPG